MTSCYVRKFLKIYIFVDTEKFLLGVKIYEVGYVLIVGKMYSLPTLSYNLVIYETT